jgi:predicted dehydrogenase
MTDVVRWGILSTGRIAKTFATALKDTSGAVLAGVGSRALADAQAFADEFGGKAYGSYEELAAADDVDLIYVGTPHPMHAANVRMALDAGKGVLCEKPFTMNRTEAEELVALARAKKLFLMEAMWTRFMPALAEVRRIVASGEIGAVHHVCSTASWAAARCSTWASIRCRSRWRCSGRLNRSWPRLNWAPPASTSRPASCCAMRAAACRCAAARCAPTCRAN